MRGSTDPQLAMLSTVSTEDLIPADHPIRRIRVVVDTVLAELDPVFAEMYASGSTWRAAGVIAEGNGAGRAPWSGGSRSVTLGSCCRS